MANFNHKTDGVAAEINIDFIVVTAAMITGACAMWNRKDIPATSGENFKTRWPSG